LSLRKSTGLRLERKKDASLLNWNLKRPLSPAKVRVVIPSGSLPCVAEHESVQTGMKIAASQTTDGVAVHASMPGVIGKIERVSDASGGSSLTVEIRRQGEPRPAPANFTETRKGWEQIPAAELPEIFRQAGLVTTDAAMEPVHAKLRRHSGVRTIVVNVCEPEPYITCEQILTQSHPVEILRGAELLKKAACAARIVFAVEECNSEVIELLKSKIYFLKWDYAEVRSVPARYPQGLESLLLEEWFGEKKDEAVIFPASTAFAVYEAVAHQKPFYERVVTVGGECVVEPRSLWLPLGISFQDAIQTCKGVMREPRKVILGGPMAGTAQSDLAVPVTAGTAAILALPKEIAKEEVPEPCLRCKRCVDTCPVAVSPAMITLAAEQKEYEIAQAWGASRCIECGNCAYVCPSKRPMLALIHAAKSFREAVFHG